MVELRSIHLSVGVRRSTIRNLDLDPCMDPPSLMASKPDEELGSLWSSDILIQVILLCVRSVAQLTRYIEQIIEQERVWGEDLA